MPAKKKRPLRRSYAGVLAGLPPSIRAQFTDTERIKSLESTLLIEQKANVDMLAALQENAKAVVELNQKLADLQKQLAAKDKELAADARAFAGINGEIRFLWEEIDRFRDRLLDHIRWEMMLPEDARVALNKVRAQEFEDKLDEDAEAAP